MNSHPNLLQNTHPNLLRVDNNTNSIIQFRPDRVRVRDRMGKTTRKLEVVSPVPADIDIANSIEPLHIAEIAQDLNLNPQHYDLYGKYKAKVVGFK